MTSDICIFCGRIANTREHIPPKQFFKSTPERPYNKPNLKIINKPKQNPWKYSLYDAVKHDNFKKSKSNNFIPIGFDDKNILQTISLSKLVHLIIVGNNISNKEFFLDTLITSLIIRESPNSLRLILSDVSAYLDYYNGVQHLLTPVIHESEKNMSALQWLRAEHLKRIRMFSEVKVRNIEEYNQKMKDSQIPRILTIINDVNELINFASYDSGDLVMLMSNFGHRHGIHFILVTNRLTNKEIPQEIQSNIPSRVIFKVSSKYDLREKTETKAEELGKGEILYKPARKRKYQKLDAIFTSEEMIKMITKKIRG